MASPSSKTTSVPGRAGWRPLEFAGSRLLGRRIYAVTLLTLRAAVRYRLIQVLTVLLLGAVIGLPAIIKHDGTAQGFTQILLTYTLGTITLLLGFATLWLGCGTLARDVEECQMQVVTVKAVHRWEIWLGKWLGIMVLNAALLAASGVSVFTLLKWRASQLPAAAQAELNTKILVARGSIRQSVNYDDIQKQADAALQERLQDKDIAALDRNFVRTQILERVKASRQLVPPGSVRRFQLQLGSAAAVAATQPLTIRTKFFTAIPSPTLTPTTVGAWWEIGPPNGDRFRPEEMSLAAETFHEFTIPPGLADAQGVLTIDFYNFNQGALLFPLEEGMEVLYPEASFPLNFARGLGIVLCWLGLLAAIGLAAGSILSFPVAAFCALGILLVSASTTTLKQVIDEGGISAVNNNTGKIDEPLLIDHVAVPFAKSLLWTINTVRGFSPIDSLSNGRSISWSELARAGFQIVLVMGGLFAALGITLFNRRELATAQGP